MPTVNGYLTIYSPDRSEIYGEFPDAEWITSKTHGGANYVFSGRASDGAMDTFTRLNQNGVSHVCYTFDDGGAPYEGAAQLLAPEGSIVQIETGEAPSRREV